MAAVVSPVSTVIDEIAEPEEVLLQYTLPVPPLPPPESSLLVTFTVRSAEPPGVVPVTTYLPLALLDAEMVRV